MNDSTMAGKVILVTGSTDGIGKATALELARRGAMVILHGRDPGRCQRALDEALKTSANGELGCFAADFSSLQEVRKLADLVRDRYDRLDVLINNAGIYMTERRLSADGYELTFAVNHLAPFLLTRLLLDLLKKSSPSRIITVASVAHHRSRLDFENLQGEKHFTGYGAYALSKLGNVLFTIEAAERLKGTGVTANCLHPGVIGTKLLRRGFGGISAGSLKEGAATTLYLATAPEVEKTSGKYFQKKQVENPSPFALDAAIRTRFWEISAQLCGLA